MGNGLDLSVPAVFGQASPPPKARPAPAGQGRRPRPPRIGHGTILLSAANQRGGSILLAFARTRGGIAFWRSLSPEKASPDRVATFPGPFTVRTVAALLASDAVRPSVDAGLAGDVWVDGLDEPEADLLRLAWCRDEGRLDPRAAAVLALSDRARNGACEWNDLHGIDGLLELGERVLDANQEWLEKHRTAVDAEVDRRAAVSGAGEEERRRLRAFVEECLLTLGRLPRPGETAGAWEGAGVAGRDLGERERRRLRLAQSGRVGRFHVWVRFWNGAESLGRGEFGSGVGWYWDVSNPDPLWIMNGTMGPRASAGDAWDEASRLQDQE
jgi:hypothetical protein